MKQKSARRGLRFEETVARRAILVLTVVLAWATSPAQAQTGMQDATGGEDPRPTIEQRFHNLDANKDGFITWAEAEPGRTGEFRSLDRNGDGLVTAEEWAGRALRLQEFDSDRNGVITQSEYLQKHRSMFESFDADRDGRISLPEFANAQQAVRGR